MKGAQNHSEITNLFLVGHGGETIADLAELGSITNTTQSHDSPWILECQQPLSIVCVPFLYYLVKSFITSKFV